MELARLDIAALREAVNQISAEQTFGTIPKLSWCSIAQMGVQLISDTALKPFAVAAGSRAVTIGGLACETGVPVSLLHAVITGRESASETGEQAKARLTAMLDGLPEQQLAKAA